MAFAGRFSLEGRGARPYSNDDIWSQPILPLYLALGAMTVQQTFATLGRATVPLIAAAILAELDLDPALVGVYVAIGAVAGFLTTLGCGPFILRFGAVRLTQIGMTMLAAGLLAGATGWLALFALGAFVGALGQAVSTPASSHLLGRLSPPARAPLMFSIKQTGVPAGLMLAGVAAPALVAAFDWRVALGTVAAASLAVTLALQPLRDRFDTDRNPDQRLSPADMAGTLTSVLRDPQLRRLCIAMFSFVGLQSLFTGFFVLYAVRALGHDLGRAGAIFAIAVAVAVPARIFWGWLASRFIAAAWLLGWLGLGMAGAAATLASIGPDWPTAATTLVAAALSLTGLSWHGVLLAEVARLSRPGRIGATTGAVLAFGDAGALVLPLLFSAALALTERYDIGFGLGGAVALAASSLLLLRARDRRAV